MTAASTGSKRRAHGRAWLWMLVCLMAILPRSAGALVLHAHEGHGLHAHLVSGLETPVNDLEHGAFHTRYHAHGEEPCEPGHVHPPGEAEIFLGLPSEPVRACAFPAMLPPVLERNASFLAVCPEEWTVSDATRSVRLRPPKPRGRVPRTGTRALLLTSPALRL